MSILLAHILFFANCMSKSHLYASMHAIQPKDGYSICCLASKGREPLFKQLLVSHTPWLKLKCPLTGQASISVPAPWPG